MVVSSENISSIHFIRMTGIAILTRQGGKGLGNVRLDGNGPSLPRLSWQSLELNKLSLLLCLLLLLSVNLDSVQELFSAFRVFDVLYSDIDSLFEVSTVDDFVADNTDSSGGDVVNDTGFAVVDYTSVNTDYLN